MCAFLLTLLQVREALLVERRRYREEREAHQMAQSDLTDLKQRYDNLLRRLNSRPTPSGTKTSATADDPVVLRVALNKCRYGVDYEVIADLWGIRERERDGSRYVSCHRCAVKKLLQ